MDGTALGVREVRLWSAMLGRGAAAVVFGVLLVSEPPPLGHLPVWLLVYLLTDGALAMYSAKRVRTLRARPLLLAFVGLADALAAVMAVVFPTALALRLVAGVRAIVTGVCDAYWSGHHRVSDLLTLGGVAAVGLGIVLLVAWPGPGLQGLPWLLGLQVIVSGSLLVAGALSELRRVTFADLQPA